MGLFDFFKGAKETITGKQKEPIKPFYSQDRDQQIIKALNDHDYKEWKNLTGSEFIDADSMLSNGETVMTQSIKSMFVQMKKQRDHYNVFSNTWPSFKVAEQKVHDNHPLAHAYAFLSNERTPVILNTDVGEFRPIKKEVISREKILRAQDEEKYNQSYTIHWNLMSQKGYDLENFKPNYDERTPKALHEIHSNNEARLPDIMKTRIFLNKGKSNKESSIDGVLRLMDVMPDAKTFISWMQNEELNNSFSWLRNYKPTEEEFMDVFDPGWRNDVKPEATGAAAAGTTSSANSSSNNTGDFEPEMEMEMSMDINMDDEYTKEQKEEQEKERVEEIRKQNEYQHCVDKLNRINFYHWQAERLAAAHPILEKINLERAQEQEKMFAHFRDMYSRNKDMSPNDRARERSRDRGMDMEM